MPLLSAASAGVGAIGMTAPVLTMSASSSRPRSLKRREMEEITGASPFASGGPGSLGPAGVEHGTTLERRGWRGRRALAGGAGALHGLAVVLTHAALLARDRGADPQLDPVARGVREGGPFGPV